MRVRVNVSRTNNVKSQQNWTYFNNHLGCHRYIAHSHLGCLHIAPSVHIQRKMKQSPREYDRYIF